MVKQIDLMHLNFAIKNMNKYFKKKSFVCASDGFFPFTDSIKLLK